MKTALLATGNLYDPSQFLKSSIQQTTFLFLTKSWFLRSLHKSIKLFWTSTGVTSNSSSNITYPIYLWSHNETLSVFRDLAPKNNEMSISCTPSPKYAVISLDGLEISLSSSL
jgi:hypothetical protein